MSTSNHVARVEALAHSMRESRGAVALKKRTSNLFRDRRAQPRRRLDVRDMNQVLAVDAANLRIDAEGMTTYEALVDAALVEGLMPAVVPQLKSITLGGAVAGVAIESSSFRQGLVHESVEELEVLTGAGEVITCRADNQHRDLFHAFPNSYGTLGYALRVNAKALPVKRYVQLEYRHHDEADAFFSDLEQACAGDANFVDGVVFDDHRLVLSVGRFVDDAPYSSDYHFEHIYYRSLLERSEDYLSTRDYLWRWDTDWFWCSKNVGAQNPVLRRLLFGRKRLNSVTYAKIMRANTRLGLTRGWSKLRGQHSESVIQDVDIPIQHCADFLAFLLREIGLLPIWICPIGVKSDAFKLYPLEPGVLYVNFGFWDVLKRASAFPPGHHNRLIEREVQRLGGIKSLYSDSYYERDEFWGIFGGDYYREIKARYDPDGVFPDLYEKCVLRR